MRLFFGGSREHLLVDDQEPDRLLIVFEGLAEEDRWAQVRFCNRGPLCVPLDLTLFDDHRQHTRGQGGGPLSKCVSLDLTLKPEEYSIGKRYEAEFFERWNFEEFGFIPFSYTV